MPCQPVLGSTIPTRRAGAARSQTVSCSCSGPTMAPAAPGVVAIRDDIGTARRSVAPTSVEACRCTSRGVSPMTVFGLGIDVLAGMLHQVLIQGGMGSWTAAAVMAGQIAARHHYLGSERASGRPGAALPFSCISERAWLHASGVAVDRVAVGAGLDAVGAQSVGRSVAIGCTAGFALSVLLYIVISVIRTTRGCSASSKVTCKTAVRRRLRHGIPRLPVPCSCIAPVKTTPWLVAGSARGGVGRTRGPVTWRPTAACRCAIPTRSHLATVAGLGIGVVGGAPG